MNFLEFIDCIRDVDISFVGNPFMWTNKRAHYENSKEHLERAIGCLMENIPQSFIRHLQTHHSYHSLITLDIIVDKDNWS